MSGAANKARGERLTEHAGGPKNTTLNDVLRLDPKKHTWRRVSRMPTARNYRRAVLFHDAVHVVGGSRSAGSSHAAARSRIVERFFMRGR